jgi:hypothetical protein
MATELMGVEPTTSDMYESGTQNESLVSAAEAFVLKLTKASVYGPGFAIWLSFKMSMLQET